MTSVTRYTLPAMRLPSVGGVRPHSFTFSARHTSGHGQGEQGSRPSPPRSSRRGERACRGAVRRSRGKPWCDPSLSVDTRRPLVKALTRDEKALAAGGHPPPTTATPAATVAVERVGLPKSYNTDGPVAYARVGDGAAHAHGRGRVLRPQMAFLHGQTMATEARAKGQRRVLRRGQRDGERPLNGAPSRRFGEDPFLRDAHGGSRWIRGRSRRACFATVKHYAANNQGGRRSTGGSDRERRRADSAVGFRAAAPLGELASSTSARCTGLPPPVRAAVRGRASAASCAPTTGSTASGRARNERCSTGSLKPRLGLKNMVMSDWFPRSHITDTVNCTPTTAWTRDAVAPTPTAGGAQAANGGQPWSARRRSTTTSG